MSQATPLPKDDPQNRQTPNNAGQSYEIHMHGALKDYFSEIERVAAARPLSIAQIKEELKVRAPQASGLLDLCRGGVDHKIVSGEMIPGWGSRIDLLPPSSGG